MRTLERGSTFGEYTLIGQHWDSALGDVWIARREGAERQTRKLYALRRLGQLDAETQTRLMSWGCAMGLVDDPGVARVVDMVFEGGDAAIVQELVVGESVRQVSRIVRGWSPLLSLSAVLVLARSLQRVYELRGASGEALNLRHGSLDAHRVVVDYERARLVLLEPGLADAIQPQGGSDNRGDVYGLAVILWEVLTGRTAPEAPARGEKGPKFPSLRACGVKRQKPLEAVLEGALHPDPDRRLASMTSFIRQLEGCLDDLGQRLDLPRHLERIMQQRLQHRDGAMRTLVERWKHVPLVASCTSDLPRVDGAPQPRAARRPAPKEKPTTSGTAHLRPASIAGLPLAEPIGSRPLAVGPAPTTHDLAGATSDLPVPKPSVTRTLRQLTWLGVLAIVALAATAYGGTEAGQRTLSTLFALLGLPS